MEHKYFRVFFSKIKEVSWLNKLGKEGYLLTKIADSRYFFTRNEGKIYSYSIEFLDASPKSDTAAEYFESKMEQQIYPVIAGKNWVYFVSEINAIEISADTYKKNSKFYFWRCCYLMFISVLGAIVCGYQAFASAFILNAKHTGTGNIAITKVKGNSFWDAICKAWNSILEFINNTYLHMLRVIFGESDAVFIIAVCLPVVIITAVLFAFNLNEYISFKGLEYRTRHMKSEEEEAETNAEQRI